MPEREAGTAVQQERKHGRRRYRKGWEVAGLLEQQSNKNGNLARPCWAQVAIPVQIRSDHRRPFSLRVPWVMCRSITTERIAGYPPGAA